jgi:UrcA family protein
VAHISAVENVNNGPMTHAKPCTNQMEIAMKNLTTLVAFATVATCSFTIARADTALEPRSETVRFADLNTTSADGIAVLYQRIKHAAENVCRDLEPGRQPALMQLYANCVHQALGDAIAKIDRPAVTAYAAARGVLPGDATIKIARNK